MEPNFISEPEVELIAITPNAADLIERAGRVCYQSEGRIKRTVRAVPADGGSLRKFGADDFQDSLFEGEGGDRLGFFDLAEGVLFAHAGEKYRVESIDRASAKTLIRYLIKAGHLSVIEHASASFLITGGSRMFTHQFVRHRLMSISQESQRYCGYNLDEGAIGAREMTWVLPPKIAKHPEALEEYRKAISAAYESYKRLQEILKTAGETKVNEDARAILPNAATSQIAVSANFREWRHIFALRCSPRAQWEIRRIAVAMLEILQDRAPEVFADFTIDREKYTAEPGRFD